VVSGSGTASGVPVKNAGNTVKIRQLKHDYFPVAIEFPVLPLQEG
jgi:hypothetical protein